jgi:hypothetical protein
MGAMVLEHVTVSMDEVNDDDIEDSDSMESTYGVEDGPIDNQEEGYQGLATLGDQSRIQGYMNQFDPAAQKPRRRRQPRNDVGDEASTSGFQPQARSQSYGRGRGGGRRSRFKGRRSKGVRSMLLPGYVRPFLGICFSLKDFRL